MTLLTYPAGATFPLHDAVGINDIETVRSLLRDHPEDEWLLSKLPCTEETVLHIAVCSLDKYRTEQTLKIIELLLQAGIRPNFRMKHSRHLSLPQELFAREAGRKTSAFTAMKPLLLQKDYKGRTALQFAVDMDLFRLSGYIGLGKKLLEILLNNDNTPQERLALLLQTDKLGDNALEQAVKNRNVEMVTLLLPYYEGLGLLAQTNKYGYNILHLAIINRNNEKIAALLLSYYTRLGLLEQILAQTDEYGKNALYMAVGGVQSKMVKMLLPAYELVGLLPKPDVYGTNNLAAEMRRTKNVEMWILLEVWGQKLFPPTK